MFFNGFYFSFQTYLLLKFTLLTMYAHTAEVVHSLNSCNIEVLKTKNYTFKM